MAVKKKIKKAAPKKAPAKVSSEFVRQDAPPNGSRTRAVMGLMDLIAEADGQPVKFEEACDQLEIKYPADVQPGLTALEVAGSIVRYTYVEKGSTKKKHAYALNKEDDSSRPTSAA